MRKFLVVITVVFILGLSVIPAFAAEKTDLSYSTVLSFDSISGSLSSREFPWPFNSTKLGVYREEFSLGDDMFYGDYTSTDYDSGNQIWPHFYFPLVAGSVGSLEVLTLSSNGIQVVPRGHLDGGFDIVANVDDLAISSVVISGCVEIIETVTDGNSGNTKYSTSFRSFQRSFHPSGNVARIGDWLNQCLNSIPEIDGQYYVLLQELKVQLHCIRQSVSTPEFSVYSAISPNRYGVEQWLYQYDLKKTVTVVQNGVADFDLTTWLSSSVGGFLSFEIAPGFSLDKILYLFLVVAVLLWFLKLIS